MPYCTRHTHDVPMVAIHEHDLIERDRICIAGLLDGADISQVNLANYRFVKDVDGSERRATLAEARTVLEAAAAALAPVPAPTLLLTAPDPAPYPEMPHDGAPG